MEEQQQIQEMCDVINDMYGADAMYFGVDSYGIACNLYKIGYRRQSEWISVDERLPDESGCYLVITKLDVYPQVYNFFNGFFHYLDDWESWCPTHYVEYWMPLPELPRMKGANND